MRRSAPTVMMGLATLGLTLTGCNTSKEVERPAAEEAVGFVQQFYADVLSGDTGQCDTFTEEGRQAFLLAMSPAESCEEAVEILGNLTHDVEEHVATHTYSLEGQSDHEVVVRADFGTYADLMSVQWIDGRWRIGANKRTDSTQEPGIEVDPGNEGHDAHQH